LCEELQEQISRDGVRFRFQLRFEVLDILSVDKLSFADTHLALLSGGLSTPVRYAFRWMQSNESSQFDCGTGATQLIVATVANRLKSKQALTIAA
jgi:hypothetical protein